jgi:hypothetical protein
MTTGVWAEPISGGFYAVPLASGASKSLEAEGGRLCNVLVTTKGTGTLTVYDNNEGKAEGTIIGFLPASAPEGIYAFDMPAAKGIYAVSASSGPAVTISYK